MNVNQLMTCDRAVMTYKTANLFYPEDLRPLQNRFIERSTIPKYNTTNRKYFHVQKQTLEYAKGSFSSQVGREALNSIPHPILGSLQNSKNV